MRNQHSSNYFTYQVISEPIIVNHPPLAMKSIALLWCLLCCGSECAAQPMLPGPKDGWQHRFRSEANAVRVLEVVPSQWTKAKRRLIVFATPNGNTLEQSYGAKAAPGLDWHFDIQHIGAQFQFAQLQTPDVDVALVLLQAGQLSWPAFRQTTDRADQQIRRLIESLQSEFQADETYLTCHSGGGSLIWGWMNAHEKLPPSVTRIAMLDANYSYSDQLSHGDKILTWLRASPSARFLVVAYDDRRVELNGKRVVDDDGGTYRATLRMIQRFEKELPDQSGTLADMQSDSFLDERILLLRHPNPQNKILHTALVGELNGFAFASLWADKDDSTDLLRGPRCYEDQIDSVPLRDPNRNFARRAVETSSRQLALPARAPNAETGTAFIHRVSKLDRAAREQAVTQAILSGNVPTWSRQLIPIEILSPIKSDSLDNTSQPSKDSPSITLHVLQDYIAIGADDDAVRMPMTPRSAWQLCDQLDCSLPTARLCDAIFSAADVRLTPQPMQKDRDQVLTILEHDKLIEKQLSGRAGHAIVVGHKKDVIVSNTLLKAKNRVAIYGWHYPSGVPIQPVYAGHVDWYTDYSHGIRMVSNRVLADGRELNYREMLAADKWHLWLSNEGTIDVSACVKVTSE